MPKHPDHNPPGAGRPFPIGLVLGFGVGLLVGFILHKLALCMVLGALGGVASDSLRNAGKGERKNH